MEGHSELEFTLHHPNTPELHQQVSERERRREREREGGREIE